MPQIIPVNEYVIGSRVGRGGFTHPLPHPCPPVLRRNGLILVILAPRHHGPRYKSLKNSSFVELLFIKDSKLWEEK
jgi:hypothetical protein